MFNIPHNYQEFKAIFIDPGLNNIGISVFTFNNDFDNLKSIDSFTIVVEKEEDIFGFDEELHGERLHKLIKIQTGIKDICSAHCPVIVGSEAPFYNPLRPNAYRALVEAIMAIQNGIYDYDKNIKLVQIPPLKVKQAVSAGSTKGKIDVLTKIKDIPEIVSKVTVSLDSLSEHAVDSIAVGWSYLKLWRETK